MVRERCSWEQRVSRRRVLGRRVLGRGCPAHLGRSRDLRAVIPAQAGIHNILGARASPPATRRRRGSSGHHVPRRRRQPREYGRATIHRHPVPAVPDRGKGMRMTHRTPRPAGRPHHHHRRELQRHAQDQGDQPARAGGGRQDGDRLTPTSTAPASSSTAPMSSPRTRRSATASWCRTSRRRCAAGTSTTSPTRSRPRSGPARTSSICAWTRCRSTRRSATSGSGSW